MSAQCTLVGTGALVSAGISNELARTIVITNKLTTTLTKVSSWAGYNKYLGLAKVMVLYSSADPSYPDAAAAYKCDGKKCTFSYATEAGVIV